MSEILRAENVCKFYQSGDEILKALDNVSFILQEGETAAVTGASGSGKSTLLGILAGLDSATSGTVKIGGREITAMNEKELAAFRGDRIGYIFQSYRLLPHLTALENVLVPLEIKGFKRDFDAAAGWLDRVGLSARMHHLPARLSGGEQQRVAIARALVTRPALILADEPTGNLDSKSGAAVCSLLFEAAAEFNTTLILVTHDEKLAAKAHREIRLHDGRTLV